MNKMVKSILMAVGVFASAAAMADGDTSYLYWMTDGLSGFKGREEWTYAKVSYSNGGKTTYLSPVYNTDTQGYIAAAKEFMTMQTAIGSTFLGDSYSYALELFNSDDEVVGLSQSLAYSANYFDTAGSMPVQTAVFTGFHVPEPTSGVLALLGFAVLGLRRKQKIA